MSDRDDALELWRAATRDLRALRGMVNPGIFGDENFGQTAQQAVEKALKTWLCLVGRTYPFSHDIDHLLTCLEQTGQNVGAFRDLDEFTPYASVLRYRASQVSDQPLDRADTIRRVAALFERLRGLIGEPA